MRHVPALVGAGLRAGPNESRAVSDGQPQGGVPTTKKTTTLDPRLRMSMTGVEDDRKGKAGSSRGSEC